MNKTLLLIAVIVLPYVSKAQTEVLADTSLELTGAGGSQWNSTSTNFTTVLCDAVCGNCNGPCVPKTGTWYAWFGGLGTGAPELGTLLQNFNVSAPGNANLSFWLKLPSSGVSADSLIAYLDSVPVWHKLGDDSVGFDTDYAQVNISLGAVASGNHSLLFRGIESGTSPNAFNILVDDISVKVDGTIGVSDFDFENGVTVFVNPAAQLLNCSFNFENASDVTITITDLMGRTWRSSKHQNLKRDDVTFLTSGMSSGLYNITFNKNGYTFSKKVVIQN